MTAHGSCLPDALRYAADLGWWLVPTRGPADPRPKAPLYRGWPDFRPAADDLRWAFGRYPAAGVGLNLGGSGLIDVEADTPDGDRFLEEFCAGVPHPCWRSPRGRHRLFRDPGGAVYARIESLGVEFRAGRHLSVLPPTGIPGGGRYEWEADPFAVAPPPMPEALAAVYEAEVQNQAGGRVAPEDRPSRSSAAATRHPYRDHFDYLFRHFDLLDRAAAEGLEFAAAGPDSGGNIACFVPAVLRGGNPDYHPSGVFNVRNGRLRDFATGVNHRYFDLIAALTGTTWDAVWKAYEAEAGAVRSHSRRLGPPSLPSGDRVPLAVARALLREYIEAQLSRPPAPDTLHLLKGPPGLGKTWEFCAALARRRRPAVVLTLENKLAGVHADLLNAADGRARRMPVLRESACPHPDEYERAARLGYQPSRGQPCRSCAIGPRRCPYLLAFSALGGADQLCAAAVYHTHAGFYAAHGNEARPVVVFDENPVDLLLAPVAHPLSAWRAWEEAFRLAAGPVAARPAFRPVLDLVDWLADAAAGFEGTAAKFAPVAVPDRLRAAGLRASPAVQYRLTQSAGRGSVPNLYDAAVYLLTEPGAHLLLERGSGAAGTWVRFRRRHPLPAGREVFVLDATASEDLIRAAAPGWDVRVWESPPVAQRGRVIQVMDYDVSRNFVRKEVARHTTHSPCWLAQVADAILDRHGPAAVVGFKAVVGRGRPDLDVLGKLRHADRVTARHHYPARGYSVPADTLIVLGTPYKDEAAVWELALAAFGAGGLPAGEYRRRPRVSGDFLTRTMSYGEDRLRAVEDFLVSADLAQAVGRVRPLQNPATVYVLSNAPVPGWEVEQVAASELFDLRKPLRRDAREGFERYADELTRRLDVQPWVGNREVCEAVGMKERTGREMMARFKRQYGHRLRVEGHRVGWAAAPACLAAAGQKW